MSMHLTMLGTGYAMCTRCFNTCFLLERDGEQFLVDAGGGNGVLVQLEKLQFDWTRLHTMFLTHGHTDHVLGAIWVIRQIATMMCEGSYTGVFSVYCHAGVREMLDYFVKTMLVPKFQKKVCEDGIRLVTVQNGDRFEALGLPVQVFDIFSSKLEQYGFQMELENGKKLTCAGDEPYNPDCEKTVSTVGS